MCFLEFKVTLKFYFKLGTWRINAFKHKTLNTTCAEVISNTDF